MFLILIVPILIYLYPFSLVSASLLLSPIGDPSPHHLFPKAIGLDASIPCPFNVYSEPALPISNICLSCTNLFSRKFLLLLLGHHHFLEVHSAPRHLPRKEFDYHLISPQNIAASAEKSPDNMGIACRTILMREFYLLNREV